LLDQSQAAAMLSWFDVFDRLIIDDDAARYWIVKEGEETYYGGLAAARWPDERDEFAWDVVADTGNVV
jgi:hypothetical protein